MLGLSLGSGIRVAWYGGDWIIQEGTMFQHFMGEVFFDVQVEHCTMVLHAMMLLFTYIAPPIVANGPSERMTARRRIGRE